MTGAPRAVLFDLDGTLLDTAPDLVRALNGLRAEDGLDPLPYATVRAQVSRGSVALTRLACADDPSSTAFETHRRRLLEIYHADIAVESRLFEGMDEILTVIERSTRPWGIVTNKPAWLTTPLLQALDLDRRAACIISGDTTSHSKPHPQPLLFAADELQLRPCECLYVGDDARDVEAARAAAMPVIVALYGYLAADDRPHAWGAAGTIAAPRDLLAWL